MQAQYCGTKNPTATEYNYFMNTIKNTPVFKNAGTECVPIKLYVFRETGGTGGVSLVNLNKGLANLNRVYFAAGIEFYFCSAPTYIDNTDLNNFDERSPDNDLESQIITAAGSVNNAVNVYFVENITLSSGFQAAGYAYFPTSSNNSNRMIMTHSTAAGKAEGTFAHEFGHYFSLFHTFEGTSNGNSNSNAENVPRTGANANCSTKGDGFCDTDADPGYSNLTSSNCVYTGTATDINGVTYNPLTAITNTMSYYPDNCLVGFSAEQYVGIAQGWTTRKSFAAYNYNCPPMTVTAPTGLTATLGSGVVLNWTDNASNEMGYIIERSSTSASSGFRALENGGTADNVSTYTDLSVSANTTYYYRVKASNGDCNSYSNVVTVVVTYCSANSTNCDEILTNVTLGTINNSSTAANCATSSYQNYTSISTNLTAGVAAPITMTTAPSYNNDSVSVWIDWNQDNDFDDAGEKIFTRNASTGSIASTITAPLTATAGNTRMRVRLFYQTGNTPCGASSYGEVEDYTVNVIIPLPSCGSETFTNSALTTSYANNSFVGDNSVTWTYIQSRDDNGTQITGKGIMLRRVADNSKVTSSLVAGGIGDFTCKLLKGFTGAGNRQVQLYVNGVLKGSSILWDNTTIQTFTVTGINVSGPVIIEIRNATAFQVVVDDISWTCYAAPVGTPVITVGSSTMSGFTYVAGSGPSTNQSNTLAWADLTANVASGNVVNYYEFSIDAGLNWYGATILNVPIPPFPATSVTPSSVLVRLKSGLAVGSYLDTVVLGSTGATTKYVYLSGTVTTGPCSELMISEYVEGSSNNKYLEIYNASSTAVNLANYDVVLYNNGSTTPSSPISLTGTLASGAVFVIANNAATAWSGTANLSTGSLNFNGNDVVALRHNSVNIDVFGVIGNSANFALDQTFTRLNTIQTPNTTYNVAEWSTSVSNTVSGLGAHITPCVAVCNISALAAGTQTACVPATNNYTQEVIVTYSTAPATGTLDVNGQSFAITTSPQTVTLTGLTSDGAAVNVTANFSANAGCTKTTNSLFTAPASCAITCSIASITAGTQTACVPATNTYTQAVVVTFANAPASGTLDVNGQSFAIGTSPQTVTLTGLTSNGASVNVTANFSANAGCTLTANSLFTAAADCTPASPCSQLFISEYGDPTSGSNKYIEIYNPTSATVNLANFRIWKNVNGGVWPGSSLSLSGNLASGDVYVVANNNLFNPNVDSINVGVTGFNGNDGVALAWNGGAGSTFSIIDVIGSNAGDPGTGWSVAGISNATADAILIRKATVQGPNANWTASAGTTVANSEWTVVSPYTAGMSLPNLGSHTSDCVDYVWTGATDTDWGTASNWSYGAIPGANNVVSIPNVSSASGNFPTITPATAVGAVTVDASAFVTVATGITLNGIFTNNGTVTLQNGAYLDDFTNSGSSFVGNIKVETVAANGVSNDQRFISSPVNTPNVTQIGDDLVGPWGTGLPGTNGVAVTMDNCALATTAVGSNYGNLFELNETLINTCEKDGWVVRSSGTLQNARGYSAYLANGSTFDFEGTPNSGAKSIAVTNSGSGVVLGEGWNLIGNPYPTAISRNKVITAGATDAQYFVTTGIYQGTFAPYLPGSNIAITQGFQVHINSNSTLNFDNSFRNTNAATWYQNENWFDNKLEVSVIGNNGADKTIVFFNQEASNGYEPMYDVVKFTSNNGKPTLSTFNNNKDLALNGFSVNDLGQTIPMNLKSGSNGNFSLAFEGKETFPANTTIYVKDLMLNTVHNIENGNYNFTSNTTDNAERFELIFIPQVEFATVNPDCNGSLGQINLLSNAVLNNRTFDLLVNNEIITSNDLVNFNVTSNVSENYEVNVHDIYGGTQTYNLELLAAETINSDFSMPTEVTVNETFSLLNLCANATNVEWNINGNILTATNAPTFAFDAAGVYEVSLTVSNNDCADTKTETIRVNNKTTGIVDVANNSINIYPNPVKDFLTIETNEKVTTKLFTILGKNISTTTSKVIDMKNLSKGVYIVQILNEKNELISINRVVKN